jgi:flagellar motility protein MotE (MotC chaperone)
MIQFARDFRLIPVVLLAAVCLLALKVSGLVFDGGYTLGDRLAGRHRTSLTITSPDTIPNTPKIVLADTPRNRSWAQEMFNYPDVTGSVGASKPATSAPGAAQKTEKPLKDPDGTVIPTEPPRITSVGERAVLERLQDRRQEIESRARELDMRENLLKQAEGRIDAKLMEFKALEAKLGAGRSGDKEEVKRFKSLVSMYENMKSKDAARIFDRLDLKILVDITGAINPRKMSDILGQMSPDAAERLTVELASQASNQQKSAASPLPSLPKIDGQSTSVKPSKGP